MGLAAEIEAGVIRHDRADRRHQDLAEDSPSVGQMSPDGGRCSWTLVSPNWALTAGHCVTSPDVDPGDMDFFLGGQSRQGERLEVHDNWVDDETFPKGWDLAMVRLNNPLSNRAPAKLYRGSGELGEKITSVGFGKTGDGYSGADEPSGTKRAGTNIIDSTDPTARSNGRLLSYDFDEPGNLKTYQGRDSRITDLEYMPAPGDSGGGQFINVDGEDRLAGVTSYSTTTDFLDFNPDREYGEYSNAVRVSQFTDWIEGNIATATGPRRGWSGDSSSGGDIAIDDHWNDGDAPGPDTSAIFRTGGDSRSQPRLEADHESERLIVRQGNRVDLRLQGYRWRLDNDQGPMAPLIVGQLEHELGEISARLSAVNGQLDPRGDVLLGYNAGSAGYIYLEDAELNANALAAGLAGRGQLKATGDSRIEVSGMEIGSSPGSGGRVELLGENATLNSDSKVFVGRRGQGRLIVRRATGNLTSGAPLSIGAGDGGRGLVEVSGTGGELDIAGNLVVGERGVGQLAVRHGGHVATSGRTIIGEGGEGEVSIESGGSLQVDGRLTLGRTGQTTLASLTAQGNGTRIDAERLELGLNASADMTVGDGAVVELVQGAVVGYQEPSALIVEGQDASGNPSRVKATHGNFVIGRHSPANLTVSDGAELVTYDASYVGRTHDTGVSQATLRGEGTIWRNQNELVIGQAAEAGMWIREGAELQTHDVVLGRESGGAGTVTLTGGRWLHGDEGELGRIGEGAAYVAPGVGDNATLELDWGSDLDVGNHEETGQGELEVGPGGEVLLHSNVDLTVDGQTLDNQLRVRNGGRVGEYDGETSLGTDTLHVAQRGRGQVEVTGGSEVDISRLRIGMRSDAADPVLGARGEMTVTGSGSRLALDEELRIANDLDGTLEITNGARARFDDALFRVGINTVGFEQAGRFIVQGGELDPATDRFRRSSARIETGATAPHAVVGFNGRGRLSVLDGARVSVLNSDLILGRSSDGEGRLRVAGASDADGFDHLATLAMEQDLVLGRNGTAEAIIGPEGLLRANGTLRIGNNDSGGGQLAVRGGRVTAGGIQVQQGAASPFNALFEDGQIEVERGIVSDRSPTLRLDGAGSADLARLTLNEARMEEPSQLAVIGAEHEGRLGLERGAELASEAAVLGDQADADGRASLARGSSWAIGGDATMGRFGHGAVEASGGSRVEAGGDVIVAEEEGATGRIELTGRDRTVAGSDPTRLNVDIDGSTNGRLVIGQGGSGELRIRDGAEAVVGSGLDLAEQATSVAGVTVSGEHDATGEPSLLHVKGGADISHETTVSEFGARLPAPSGSAQVSVSDGAEFVVEGRTDIGTVQSAHASVFVEGARMRTGGLAVANPDMLSLSSGELAVEGQGAEMTGFAGRDLILGDGSGSSGPEQLKLKGAGLALARAEIGEFGEIASRGDTLAVGHQQPAALRLMDGASMATGEMTVGSRVTGSTGASRELASVGPPHGFQGAAIVGGEGTQLQVDLGVQVGADQGDRGDGNGLLEIADGARVSAGGDVKVNEHSDVRLKGGTLATNQLVLGPASRLEGIGTIEGNLSNAGQISPGLSAGRLEVDGGFINGSAGGLGELVIEVFGDTPGEEFDVLEVEETAILEGELTLDWAPSFTPRKNLELPFLQADQVVGEFSQINLSRPESGPEMYFSRDGGSLAISTVPEPDTLVLLVIASLLMLPLGRRRPARQ
jgi:T5SS/PEP-CTERM-associated repeat protein